MKTSDKILCTRLLQTLDSEERFGVPYGTLSPFHFAFRDFAFSHPSSRSYKYYMDLRTQTNIKEYRQAVVDLYQDDLIEIDVNGESRKFPIQIVPIPKPEKRKLSQIAQKNGYENLLADDSDWLFLSSLPSPRLLGNPPQGTTRSDYLDRPKTNKVIDIAMLVPEINKEEGKKSLAMEISKCLAPVEQTLHFVSKIAEYLKNSIPKPIGISLRGTIADNPAMLHESFRVPVTDMNFLQLPTSKHWPTLDIDLDIFCGEEDFKDIHEILKNADLFLDVNAEIKFFSMKETIEKKLFLKDKNLRSIDIYLMTEEWVMQSVQRHINLGFEQPWTYYYFSSYPVLFEDWDNFLQSLNKHIFN